MDFLGLAGWSEAEQVEMAFRARLVTVAAMKLMVAGAKAQAELVNPEKSLFGSIIPDSTRWEQSIWLSRWRRQYLPTGFHLRLRQESVRSLA
jgi:hypothetical protein